MTKAISYGYFQPCCRLALAAVLTGSMLFLVPAPSSARSLKPYLPSAAAGAVPLTNQQTTPTITPSLTTPTLVVPKTPEVKVQVSPAVRSPQSAQPVQSAVPLKRD